MYYHQINNYFCVNTIHKFNMKSIILLIYIFLSIFNTNAQQITLSDSAEVSLITCSPGEEVYSKFGHTAIRIKDKGKGIDLVYNYGIFSFETKDFYFKFIKGETDYQLGVYDANYFLHEYAARNSMVWEQKLNLTPTEKKNLIQILQENYEPKNRIYRYNFIFDNCSTRPRDKIIEALHGFVRFPEISETKSFRQWVGVYVGHDTWLKFGIDLIFGLEADRIATQSESMFLPEVLMNEFQNGQIATPNSQIRKLVNNDKIILVDKEGVTEETHSWILKPTTFSILLLIIGILITIWDISRKRIYKPFDSALLVMTGLAGLIAFYLMAFSTHPLVKLNLNILWLNPLNLIVAIIIWYRQLRVGLFSYQVLNILLLVGALFAFSLSSQVFNVASFPLIVLLLIRTTSWFAITKRRIFRHRDIK